jgi:hypothetical protein
LPATEGEIKNSLNPLSVVKGREISPDGQLMDVQAALESVNKFKILRPKFELVTADYQKTSRSSNERQPEMNGPNDINGVRKLEDKRSLVFQQELINGRKWDSVEELEHIARRASCGDRRYVIEAVHQIPPVSVELFFCFDSICFRCIQVSYSFRPTKWIELVVVAMCLHRTSGHHSSKWPDDPHLPRPLTIRPSKFFFHSFFNWICVT